MIAVAFEEVKLHLRLHQLLMRVGSEPRWIMACLMIVTSCFSMFVSNTATTAMMTPIVISLSTHIIGTKRKLNPNPKRPVSTAVIISLETLDREETQIVKALLLATCYSTTFGGASTLTGTTPNLVLAGLLVDAWPDNPITFSSWLLYSLFGLFVNLLMGWLMLQAFVLGLGTFESKVRILCQSLRGHNDRKTSQESAASTEPVRLDSPRVEAGTPAGSSVTSRKKVPIPPWRWNRRRGLAQHEHFKSSPRTTAVAPKMLPSLNDSGLEDSPKLSHRMTVLGSSEIIGPPPSCSTPTEISINEMKQQRNTEIDSVGDENPWSPVKTEDEPNNGHSDKTNDLRCTTAVVDGTFYVNLQSTADLVTDDNNNSINNGNSVVQEGGNSMGDRTQHYDDVFTSRDYDTSFDDLVGHDHSAEYESPLSLSFPPRPSGIATQTSYIAPPPEPGNLWAEVSVVIVFVALLFLWVSRKPLWGPWLPFCTDGTAAILMSIFLFAWPLRMPTTIRSLLRLPISEFAQPHRGILTWNIVEKRMPWGIVFLLGGGFALGHTVKSSGLLAFVGHILHSLDVSNSLICIISVLLMTGVAQVASKAAAANIMLPIIMTVATGRCINPLYLMLPVTKAASFAYMLPVSTPPNAIVYRTGILKVSDLIVMGFFMNIVSICEVMLSINTWATFMFDLNSWPSWAGNNTECLELDMYILTEGNFGTVVP